MPEAFESLLPAALRTVLFGDSHMRSTPTHNFTLERKVNAKANNFSETLFATENYVLTDREGRRRLFIRKDNEQYIVSQFNGVLHPITVDRGAARRAQQLRRSVVVTEVPVSAVDLAFGMAEFSSAFAGSVVAPYRALQMRSETHRAVIRGSVITLKISDIASTCLNAYRFRKTATLPYDWRLEADEVVAAGQVEVLTRHRQQMRTERLTEVCAQIENREEKEELLTFSRS